VGGTEALRGFPSLLGIDHLQTMNRPMESEIWGDKPQ